MRFLIGDSKENKAFPKAYKEEMGIWDRDIQLACRGCEGSIRGFDTSQ